MTTPPTRVPGIDGLRGLAILALVLSHQLERIGPVPGAISRMAGASIVMLFALTAFIVTERICREIDERGALDVRAWLLRKAARTYPTLLGLLAVTTLVQQVIGGTPVPPGRYLAFLSMTGNYYYALATEDVYRHAVGHLWSVMVGAQLLVVWALVLARLYRPGRPGGLVRALVLVVVGSAIIRDALPLVTDLPAAYYYLATEANAGELAIGALAALIVRGDHPVGGVLRLPEVPMAALATLVVTVVVGNGPGIVFVQSVACTALVAHFAAPRTHGAARWLDNPVLRAASLLAWSLFAWHIQALRTDALVAGLPLPLRMPVGLLLVVAACGLAWVVLEWPVRVWLRRRA